MLKLDDAGHGKPFRLARDRNGSGLPSKWRSKMTLTKTDVEDALRRVLDSHNRSPWLDTEAAATYLSSTPGTLRSWRALGGGHRYHVIHGKSVRYNVTDLDAFIRGEDGR
jgi:hypothetical protein